MIDTMLSRWSQVFGFLKKVVSNFRVWNTYFRSISVAVRPSSKTLRHHNNVVNVVCMVPFLSLRLLVTVDCHTRQCTNGVKRHSTSEMRPSTESGNCVATLLCRLTVRRPR
jgi:hypothetical protein